MQGLRWKMKTVYIKLFKKSYFLDYWTWWWISNFLHTFKKTGKQSGTNSVGGEGRGRGEGEGEEEGRGGEGRGGGGRRGRGGGVAWRLVGFPRLSWHHGPSLPISYSQKKTCISFAIFFTPSHVSLNKNYCSAVTSGHPSEHLIFYATLLYNKGKFRWNRV